MNELNIIQRDVAEEVASHFMDDIYVLEKEIIKLKERITLLEKDNSHLELFGSKWFDIAMDLIHERKAPSDYVHYIKK